jgi:ABC-type antimicrobial peptide transport system permease subunit
MRTTATRTFDEFVEAVVAGRGDDAVMRLRAAAAIRATSARTSFTLVMLAIAASMALPLGLVGIYGVIANVVSQRRREIGIRAALGARQGELRRIFVRYGLGLSGIGVVVGLVAAAALTRLLSTLLNGITPLDPATYLAVPLVLALAIALASHVPARRAASVNPVESLAPE